MAVFSRVQSRTLQDTVTLTGTLSRKSIRNVDAANQGIVSSLTSAAGDITQAGQTMFALGGRNAVAEPGSLPFFRSLVPGDSGPDVLELKQILAASGDYPGPIDDNFTQQTQFALAQWQAQQGYPNSTPANPEAATVSLEQGTGYQLGTQDSAPLVIGPTRRAERRRTAPARVGRAAHPGRRRRRPRSVSSSPSSRWPPR